MRNTPNETSQDVFELKLSNLSPATPDAYREALVHVCDNIDFAKRILLQNRVRDFSAADVVAVAKMILEQQEAILSRNREQAGRDE